MKLETFLSWSISNLSHLANGVLNGLKFQFQCAVWASSTGHLGNLMNGISDFEIKDVSASLAPLVILFLTVWRRNTRSGLSTVSRRAPGAAPKSNILIGDLNHVRAVQFQFRQFLEPAKSQSTRFWKMAKNLFRDDLTSRVRADFQTCSLKSSQQAGKRAKLVL